MVVQGQLLLMITEQLVCDMACDKAAQSMHAAFSVEEPHDNTGSLLMKVAIAFAVQGQWPMPPRQQYILSGRNT